MTVWFKSTLSLLLLKFTPVLLLALYGCSKPPIEPLSIASSPWPGYEPLYLARDLGYLSDDRFRLFELPSADITMEAFRNHSTEAATITLDETLELLHDGMKLKIVLVMDVSHGGDAVLARPGITSAEDIKGKTISIINIPLGFYMLNRFLDSIGLDRKDVSVITMSESKQLDFYQQGKADLVITFEPVKTHLVDSGANVLFDSSMIPNEIFDMLVVREDVYNKRKGDLCLVVNAWFDALSYIESDREDAALRITRRLRLLPEEFESMFSGILIPDKKENYRLLGGEKPELVEASRRLARIMQAEGQLVRLVDAGSAVDKSFAQCFRR